MKLLAAIPALLLTSLLNGQVFFNNIYTYESGPELSTSIVMLDSTYLQLSAVGFIGESLTQTREISADGITLNTWTSNINESDLTLINYSGAIIETSDGHQLWAGFRDGPSNSAFAIKFDRDIDDPNWFFDIEWSEEVEIQLFFAHEMPNNNYLIAGERLYDYDVDPWPEEGHLLLYLLDQEGNELQTLEHNLVPEKWPRINDAINLSNGNILLTGSVMQPWDCLSLEITSEGEVVWFETWGHEIVNDWLPSAFQTSDSTIQYIYPYGEEDVWELTLGPLSTLRTATYNRNTHTFSNEIVLTDTLYGCYLGDAVRHEDGSIFCAGYSYEYESGEDVLPHGYGFVAKLTPDFELEWFKKYYHFEPDWNDPMSWVEDNFYDIEIAHDGGLICHGDHYYFDADSSTETFAAWTVKMDVCGNLEWDDCAPIVTVDEPLAAQTLKLYPNPTKGTLHLAAPEPLERVEVFSPAGQQVLQWFGQNKTLELDLSPLAAGTYLVVGQMGEGVVREWVVVE